MIFNMVGGGGAGGASIFIVNSVNERPTNVFNNTLWVNTGVDVVKYVFSDNEPSNPTEGMLWLTISNSDNVNVAAPINKDWMKFNLGIVRQYIGGAWERKMAQLYKDGIWVDVSRMFVAYIDITYPANSNCVVTNSIGQTVASNTNSTSSPKTFTAIVDATGTYTVTATDSADATKTKSASFEITTEGQFESVTLSYSLVVYEAGTFGVSTDGTTFKATRKDDNNTASSITKEDTYMLWECGANAYCMFYISPRVSCAGYKTLNISVTNASMTIDTDDTGKGKWGLSSSTNVGATGFVATKNFSKFSGSKILSLDVSNVADTAYYIAMQFGTPTSGGSFSARVTKIWLE